jgi:hypothetical protein
MPNSNDTKVACTLVDLDACSSVTGKCPRESSPFEISQEISRQCGFPQVEEFRICWGSTWEDGAWHFTQSGGVITTSGPLPRKIRMSHDTLAYTCGMHTPRETPFSSLEAAVEVGRSLSHRLFDTPTTRRPWTLCSLASVAVGASAVISVATVVAVRYGAV